MGLRDGRGLLALTCLLGAVGCAADRNAAALDDAGIGRYVTYARSTERSDEKPTDAPAAHSVDLPAELGPLDMGAWAETAKRFDRAGDAAVRRERRRAADEEGEDDAMGLTAEELDRYGDREEVSYREEALRRSPPGGVSLSVPLDPAWWLGSPPAERTGSASDQ